MALRFYNTLTRRTEEFKPLEPGTVRMYTCGPTVYDYPHIGNFRAYIFEDLLRRYFKFKGFNVVQVMNITDVDDKTIRGAREGGVSLNDFTSGYVRAFFEDLDTLRIERAEHYPAATEHIDDMVALIERLKQNGYTYEADGSTYFRIASFDGYGKLSHFKLDELKDGASGRTALDEYTKEDVRDFALWKAWTEEDGDACWDTALGRGRPGWHIECSAMSMKYLGEHFDIHTGGVDNIFPHHENEIAQSEAASGVPFVSYWLHCEHLLVDNRKMSKSLGNFYTLRDLLQKECKPEAIRYALISTHYRQKYNFTLGGLEGAMSAVNRLRDFKRRLAEVKRSPREQLTRHVAELVSRADDAFVQSMDDDLGISGALAAVFDLVREVNGLIDERAIDQEGAALAAGFLERVDTVIDVIRQDETIPQEVLELVGDRASARRDKEYKRADEIRDEILSLGYIVEDTPTGPRVKRV
jgi:cysteinyl-tRNA synthetase